MDKIVRESFFRLWLPLLSSVVAAGSIEVQAAAPAAQSGTSETRQWTASESIPSLEAAARKGDAAAQYELARRLVHGQGVATDKERALQLLKASAGQQFSAAEYELAREFRGIGGGTRDPQKSLSYLQQSASHGYMPAQVDLAFAYFNGNDQVHKDLIQSRTWFEKAAQGDSVIAQCMLGDFYKQGLGGLHQDADAAFKWYKRAAPRADRCAPKAQYELYLGYETGNGVRKNKKLAIDWLKKAAEGNNPAAQRTLGRHYERGDGVPRDPELAVFWQRKSREGVAPHDDHLHDEDEHDHEHAPERKTAVKAPAGSSP